MDSKTLTINDVITALGGPTKAATTLGLASPSVVLNWRLRGSIPARYVMAVEKATGIPAAVLRPDVFSGAGNAA